MKKKTTIILIILGLIAVCLIGRAVWNYHTQKKEKEALVAQNDMQLERISYDASEEILKAKEEFETTETGALIIRDQSAQTMKSAALVFQGVSDRSTAEQIIQILKKYDCSATFCIAGNIATEDADLLQLIEREGFTIADNGLNGDTFMENLSPEELIGNFATSHKIFSTLLNVPPSIMMCNSTFYSDTVTRAAKVCGYEKLISASAGKFINKSSFKDYDNTCEYAAKLKGANVLVIKMQGALTPLEYEASNAVIDPAKDKQETITETVKKDTTEDDPETDILTVVDWLLKALRKEGVAIVSTSNMKAQTDEEYIADLIKRGAGDEAEPVEDITTIEKAVGLLYTGIPNEENAKALVELLSEKGAQATFFADEEDIRNAASSVKILADAGFKIGIVGSASLDRKENTPTQIYRQFVLRERQVLLNEGRICRYYYPLSGHVTEDVALVAKALGYTIIIPAQNAYFGQTLANGMLLRLVAGKDTVVSDTQKLLNAAQKSGMAVYDMPRIIASGKARPVIEETVIAKLREDNEGKLAPVHDTVYTTEKAFSFLFFGISNRTTLEDVLSRLKQRNYQATFFATYDEFINCTDQVKQILDDGHELGIAYTETETYPQEFNSVAAYLLGVRAFTEWKYELTPTSVMMPYGTIADETKEAIRACGMECVGKEISLVQTKYVDETDVKEFFYPLVGRTNLHRGSLIYIHMNAFTADIEDDTKEGNERDAKPEGEEAEIKETVTGQLLSRFIINKVAALTYRDVYGKYIGSTAYRSRSYHDLAHSSYNWSPGGGGSEISADKNVLTNTLGYGNAFPYLKSRYIGNYNAGGANSLPGFSAEEVEALDVSGKFTNDPVLFLTFDDWGTDYSINQLLYVLKKYGVKATFFFRTGNIPSNPNLLRAIAVEGHEIASHTDQHLALSDDVFVDAALGSYLYGQISMEESDILRKDLEKSYHVLHRYAGNVSVNGKPALSLNFRPPTLAVSRLGLYDVFDVGYQYSISGDFSTNDYEASSVDELVGLLSFGKDTWDGHKSIGSGSVIVMHMSENAAYTAEALDIMIPLWQQAGFTFARIDDYLK